MGTQEITLICLWLRVMNVSKWNKKAGLAVSGV
jgi:hypothetical protein